MDQTTHIQQAIAQAGGPVAVARLTGAPNYQAVQQWAKAGNVPPEYAPALETASGVSRRLICRNWQRIWPELAQAEGQEAA